MFYKRGKNGPDIKTPLTVLHMKMKRIKVSFMETSQTCLISKDLDFFLVFFSSDIFSSGLIPVISFLETLLAAL